MGSYLAIRISGFTDGCGSGQTGPEAVEARQAWGSWVAGEENEENKKANPAIKWEEVRIRNGSKTEKLSHRDWGRLWAQKQIFTKK